MVTELIFNNIKYLLEVELGVLKKNRRNGCLETIQYVNVLDRFAFKRRRSLQGIIVLRIESEEPNIGCFKYWRRI